jgi:hypothetical protein
MKDIAQAAEKLGWEWIICTYNPGLSDETEKEKDRRNKKDFLKALNLHCALHLMPQEEWCLKKAKNFLHLHFPACSDQIDNGEIETSCYDGFLAAGPMDRLNKLRQLKQRYGEKLFAIQNYPSTCKTLFSNNLSRRKLFYCGINWGDRGNSEFTKFWRALASKGYFEAYGPSQSWKNVPDAYRGPLPWDPAATVNKARECGVALVIHGKEHRNNGFMAYRPLQAAAGGAVIISDQNPRTEECFGDSILYIDMNKPMEQIVADIDNYMQWILANQKGADELARRSHQIFFEKFAMEDLTRDILDLYESVMQGRAIPGSKVVED